MKRLIVVANRLPVSIVPTEDGHALRPSSGGLVSAVQSYLQGFGKGRFDATYWAGIPDCRESVWNSLTMDEDSPYTMLPVFAGRKIYDAYYNGFSNSTLWPLFHYFPSIAEFNQAHFRAYEEINRVFAAELAKVCRAGDVVWIHDYHLLLLPAMLRALVPGVTIGFFLHIPFPSFEILRIMPRKWQSALLEGMLGSDLIGFHTIDYVQHFQSSIRAVLRLESDGPMISFANRKIKAEVFPIGIDYHKFHDAFDDPDVAHRREALLQEFSGKKLIFSVDRLDYTKGVSQRLKAYELFLNNHPEWQGKVVFSLVVVPSRDSITKYAERKKLIDEFIGNLNSRLGTMFWQPVIYHYTHLEFGELMALYSSCDMALITPLRDGMNLVCKEFVASRKDGRGVLVLSDMTGAARELQDALIINPNDTEDIADCILQGLLMPPEEQEQRMRTMQERVRRYDVSAWAGDFFRQLGEIKSLQMEFEYKFLDQQARTALLDAYEQAERRIILLDYDGTLVPFASHPAKAFPHAALLQLLQKLLDDPRNLVYVISGRDSHTLDRWLGHLPVRLIAEHGAKWRSSDAEWSSSVTRDGSWHEAVDAVMSDYVVRCPHSFIETKDHSIAWHYRNADALQGQMRAKELIIELQGLARDMDLSLLDGNKVVEVRSAGFDKGTAVGRILMQEPADFVLAIGDDVTDEDMFRRLAPDDRAFTVKVGSDKSFAKYNLHTPYMVYALLELMSETGAAAGQPSP